MSANELYTLLYGILDKLERIESHLGIKDSSVDLDGGVKFRVVEDADENVVELHPKD
jgi:hypothetical protein